MSIFELDFFRWVRILPEIDWYHYQGASPAPTCIVPYELSVTSEPSEGGGVECTEIEKKQPNLKLNSLFHGNLNDRIKIARSFKEKMAMREKCRM